MINKTAEIVSAYLRRNQVPAGEVPALIQSVNQALAGLGKAPTVSVAPTPFVSIRASNRPDQLICLDCGFKAKMIKRHLTRAHNMTPKEYRTKWGLASDYPMTATDYSARRSELAKQVGLGKNRRKRSTPKK